MGAHLQKLFMLNILRKREEKWHANVLNAIIIVLKHVIVAHNAFKHIVTTYTISTT